MSTLTASKVGRAKRCLYWLRPDVATVDSPAGEAAMRGDRIHRAVETGGDTELSDSETLCASAARRYMAERNLPHGKDTVEVAMSLLADGTTVRLGNGRDAYINAAPGSVCGTADVLVQARDQAIVVDWKTSDRSAMKSADQLLALAAMTGAEFVRVAAVWLKEDGSYEEFNVREYSFFELEDERMELQLMLCSVGAAEPVPGDHCAGTFCELRGTCPAFTEAAEAVSAELIPASGLVRRRMTDPILTDQDVADVLPLLDKVEEWVEATRKAIRARVEAQGSVQLGEGKEYRLIQDSKGRETVDGRLALSIAERLGAEPHELAACMKTGAPAVRLRVVNTAESKAETPKPRKLKGAA